MTVLEDLFDVEPSYDICVLHLDLEYERAPLSACDFNARNIGFSDMDKNNFNWP